MEANGGTKGCPNGLPPDRKAGGSEARQAVRSAPQCRGEAKRLGNSGTTATKGIQKLQSGELTRPREFEGTHGTSFSQTHSATMTKQNGHSDSSGGSQSDRDESGRDEVVGRSFSSERVVLDGTHFEDCTFDTCTLVYGGGRPPHFVRCDFAAPRFVFEDAAQNTIQLMSAIYGGIDERIIEKTFDEIRKGFGPA